MDKSARAAYYTYWTLTNLSRTDLMTPEIPPWETLSHAEQGKWYAVAEAAIESRRGSSITDLESED